jgi:hypothetical protein
VSGPSLCDRVREHGNVTPEKRARFHLEENPFLPLLEKKIETVSPYLDLRGSHYGSLQTRNLSVCQKIVSHSIGQMGMEHDGLTVPFDPDHRIPSFSLLKSVLPDKVETAARQQ